MAGIYLHIPFCKQACTYCDFHFSTSLKNKSSLLAALKREMTLRKLALEGKEISTVYFGGGTPSMLNDTELKGLLDELAKHYNVSDKAEITLEANPDDLTQQRINELKKTPVNRLSIGVQSFYEEDLRFMNRSHNAEQANRSIVQAQDAGFENITIDLIYGTPSLSANNWKYNLAQTKKLGVPHLSAYCLTVEPRTALQHQIAKGKIAPLDDNKGADHFNILIEWAKRNEFIQYEISNFGKEGFFSKHNTSYWQQKHYLGFGPSAHSYNGDERQWNVRNNLKYIQSLERNELDFERELLSPNDRFNEYIMTSLRTIWGISREEVGEQFGNSYWKKIAPAISDFQHSGEIIISDNRFTLSEKGKLVADKIASILFVTD